LKRAGINQTELAKRTGISREMIVKYIAGKAPMPMDKAYVISQTLNCEMKDLYEWFEE
jgi:transcriptional regulator with XRE-family HTH domain